MNKITLCFEFSGGRGYAYVNLVPSNYGIYKQDFSGCHEFQLGRGIFTIYIDGVSPAGGTKISATINDDRIITKRVTSAGHFSKVIEIDLNENI